MTSNTEMLKEIKKTTHKTMIEMIKLKEHVKGMNGSIKRHEDDISNLYTSSTENSKDISRIKGYFAAVSIVAGLIGSFITWLITKFK